MKSLHKFGLVLLVLVVAAAARAQQTGVEDQLASQSANQSNIDVQPVAADETANTDTATYTGEVTGFSFQDIPVRSVLQILADYYEFSLVAGDSVTGNVTIELENVPWDQALELVLRTQDLDSRIEGNVLYVAPAEEIAARELASLQAAQQAQAVAPLYTDYVQVNYANAQTILELLLSGSGGPGSPSGVATGLIEQESRIDSDAVPRLQVSRAGEFLSARGSAVVDERTNIIIVRDTDARLREIRGLLARLDVPVRQVLIEARIVNVATDFGRDLGVRWGGVGSLNGTGDNWRYGGSQGATLQEYENAQARQLALQEAIVAGEDARLQALQSGTAPALIPGLVNQVASRAPVPTGAVLFPESLAVDLGVESANASSFSIGFTGSSGMIELELSALESSGNGEVIARPKVTTQDKVTAEIRSGVRIPYQSQAGGTAGGSTTEFEDAVLSMQVTPQITPDGRINMELAIQQDSVAPGSGSVPAINTNEVLTSALVDDGETIVLGGVFREENTSTEIKTPFLGDLPLLGRLFKRTSRASRRTELLIFITPKIIQATP